MGREYGSATDIETWGSEKYVSTHLLADQGENEVRKVLIHQAEAKLPDGYVMVPDSGKVEFVRRDDPRWAFKQPDWPEDAVLARTTIRCHQAP
jgi:hypothetical protein